MTDVLIATNHHVVAMRRLAIQIRTRRLQRLSTLRQLSTTVSEPSAPASAPASAPPSAARAAMAS